jgi:glycolate oxidase iron-sulfur subunit
MNTSLENLASQCVRCGLCLPHCPTYRVGREEAESPRGRIQLLAAFAKQELEWSQPLQTHIDQCLSCGHCERVCPIPVSYEHLLVQGREALAKKHSIAWWKKVFIRVMEIPKLRNILFFLTSPLIVMPAKAGIQLNFNKARLDACLRRHDDFMNYSTRELINKKILLFPGCTGEWMGQKTFLAAQALLEQLGFEVILPPQAWCCGALSAHGGLGLAQTKKTIAALEKFCAEKNIQDVITFATGCGGWMKKQFPQVQDIQQFLLDHWPENFPFKAEKTLRVVVHSPCTQTNALRNKNLSHHLLSKIPGIELIPFGENTCCGAAGLYMFEHPKISQQLIAQLFTPALLASCDVITTSNIGCQIQFERYLKKLKIKKRVCHPIELIAECLTTCR